MSDQRVCTPRRSMLMPPVIALSCRRICQHRVAAIEKVTAPVPVLVELAEQEGMAARTEHQLGRLDPEVVALEAERHVPQVCKRGSAGVAAADGAADDRQPLLGLSA